MNQQTNKYILITVFLAMAFSLVGFLMPQKAEATGGGGPQCYTFIQSMYYRKTTCPTDPSVNPEATACYFQPDTAQRQGRTSYSVVDCGTVIQKNNECVTNSCYEGATADGTGRPAKNNDSGGQGETAPPPITSEERNKLANCDGQSNPQKCLEGNPLVSWTRTAINFLAAGVGVIVTIMIIVGGIQYASAGPNPQAVQAAKKKITNAIIALLAFFFLYAFMQYLIPGGVF